MLSELEVAAGVPLPARDRAARLDRSNVGPRAALEQLVLAALRRPTCVVSFSGGRDSSLVLAAAVTAARQHGLPLPVPVTVRVSGDLHDEEHRWQETVIRHLGVDDWVRIAISDEFECIGPIARDVLLRHGVLWPANTHFHVPQFERAAGGSVLTGIGGDEIFSGSRWQSLRRALRGDERPRARHALQLAAVAAPRALRARVFAARKRAGLEWLRPEARGAVMAALAAEAAAEPVSWAERLAWLQGLRYLELARASLATVAADYDVEVVHPLIAPEFARSLAALPRGSRYDDRSQALGLLFADLLPPGLATRVSKAAFTGTLWGEASRSFAASWEGDGVDPAIVDVDALCERWRLGETEGPHTLLQWLWLRAERDRQAAATAASTSSTTAGMTSHERRRRTSQAGNALS